MLLVHDLSCTIDCVQAAEDREDWQRAMLAPLVDGSAMAQLELVTGSEAVETLQVDDALRWSSLGCRVCAGSASVLVAVRVYPHKSSANHPHELRSSLPERALKLG
jgi:hypothetical protein